MRTVCTHHDRRTPDRTDAGSVLDALARLMFLASGLILLLMLEACAMKDIEAPSKEDIMAGRDSFSQHLASRTCTESQESYISGRRVPRREDSLDTAIMRTQVTLRQRGTLREIAASISRATPVSALVASQDSDPGQKGRTGTELDDLLPDLPPGPDMVDISYQGTLRGLLDSVASLSGYGWDYDASTRRVTFSGLQTRIFVLNAPAGAISWESQVSNKSREQQGSSASGTGSVNATTRVGDTATQTAQVNSTRVGIDVWKDAETTVRGLLSKAGSVTVNQAAGTIVVRDTWARLREVRRCLEEINARLERQIALRVRVWALEVSDTRSADLGLQALFSSPDVDVVAGSAAATGQGLASVRVLKGRLEGSTGALEALSQWGHATQLTSASGLVLNNQPFPVQAIRRHAYLAGMTLSTSEYSQTSEITPGEVTTGFAMTIVPHILPDRHVLLQYNVTLSSLEDMTTIERGTVYVQLPQVATRAFSQRTRLKAGQTLMLAGFEQDTAQAVSNLGILSGGTSRDSGKTLLIVTIELEGADNV